MTKVVHFKWGESMPIITIWGIAAKGDQKLLKTLYEHCVTTITQIKKLKLTRDQITFLFPPDQLKVGAGEEIIVFVDGLFVKPERTDKVRSALAKALGARVKHHFPESLVEVFVRPFDPAQGFWTSKKEPCNIYRAVRQFERMLGPRAGVGNECLDHHR
jgi:hypothetical protein